MSVAGFLPQIALITTANAVVTYFYETIVVSCLSQFNKKSKGVA